MRNVYNSQLSQTTLVIHLLKCLNFLHFLIANMPSLKIKHYLCTVNQLELGATVTIPQKKK